MLTNLKAEMILKGKTSEDMAEILGMSPRCFDQKLNGQREFSLLEVLRLAEYFGTSVDYIAKGDQDP